MTDHADQAHRTQMVDWLHQAAHMLGVTTSGDVQFGWFDRTAGVLAQADDGRRWLRLVQEAHEWAGGDFWTGNQAANEIPDVRRPRVFDAVEWSDADRRYRAELMTFITDQPISASITVESPPTLDPPWWTDLHASLDAVSAHTTTRVRIDPDQLRLGLLAAFGVELDAARVTVAWTTAHGDLQWSNLTAPACWLLDWESWGTAPHGYDAATLYCVSLTDTKMAAKVRDEFAAQLNTPGGAVAQLAVTMRLLKLVETGRYRSLAPVLHHEAQRAIRTYLPEAMP